MLFAGLRLVIVGLPCHTNLFLIAYYARGNMNLIFSTKTLNGGIFDLPNHLVICMKHCHLYQYLSLALCS